MEETISLQDLVKTLKKRIGLIVLITILAVAAAGIISFFVLTPTYQATTQILVNQDKSEASQGISQNIQADLQLINTYSVIIKSTAILTKVVEELDLNRTAEDLNRQITIDNAQSSQVINLTVEDPDPKMAVEIANTTASVFEEEIYDLMQVNNVSILTSAIHQENPSPVSPNGPLNMAIAAVVGLMLGMGAAFLIEYLDTSMKSEQDIEDVLAIPVLGLVSPIPEQEMAATDIPQRRKRGQLNNGES